jgi:hypothetical protein
MVLLGLLAALLCLILGLVLASGPWLIASLVASALSAVVLWHQRDRIGRAASRADVPAPSAPSTTPSTTASTTPSTAAVRASRPGGDVWVVDGRPDYHRQSCEQLAGAEAENISLTQALKDGFRACPTCRPDHADAQPDEVWVVDGRPRYHRETCLILKGQHAEPIPRAQAQEDGFIPCTNCEPDLDPGTGRR